MGVKFGTEELRAKFHPHRCNVWPLRGENPQNRPLSNLNNRHFALRAMLPVKNAKNSTPCKIVTPENFILKLGTCDYVEKITHYTNFHVHRFSGGFPQIAEI